MHNLYILCSFVIIGSFFSNIYCKILQRKWGYCSVSNFTCYDTLFEQVILTGETWDVTLYSSTLLSLGVEFVPSEAGKRHCPQITWSTAKETGTIPYRMDVMYQDDFQALLITSSYGTMETQAGALGEDLIQTHLHPKHAPLRESFFKCLGIKASHPTSWLPQLLEEHGMQFKLQMIDMDKYKRYVILSSSNYNYSNSDSMLIWVMMRQQLSTTEKERLTKHIATQLESTNKLLMYKHVRYCAKLKRACYEECAKRLRREYDALQSDINRVCASLLRNHTGRITYSLTVIIVSFQIVYNMLAQI